MDNLIKPDKSNWTLRDWVMAETGDGQSRAEYIEFMKAVETRSVGTEPLFTPTETEILFGYQFDLARITAIPDGAEQAQATKILLESLYNQLKNAMTNAARARREKQPEKRLDQSVS